MRPASAPSIVISAAGTGGHMFPALSVAQELRARGYQVCLVTDARGARLSEIPEDLNRVVLPTRRLGGVGKGGIAFDLMKGIFQMVWRFVRERPTLVMGFGGFPSFPAVFSATLLGIPVGLHEQNAVLGRVNRWMAWSVKFIALSYEKTRYLSERMRRKSHMTGMPLRPALSGEAARYRPPEEGAALRVLILGGSQGAAIFSQVLPEALKLLSTDNRAQLRLVQQCRAEDLEAVRTAYEAMGVQAELSPFFVDVPAHLRTVHLVVSRAGAATLSEVAAVGCPALLVPYLWASDDHQTANAESVLDVSGGWRMLQKDFTPERLKSFLEGLLRSPKSLLYAAEGMRTLKAVKADTQLVDLIETTLKYKNKNKNKYQNEREHA